MKLFRRCQRILILSLLSVSVFAPVIFVSQRLKNLSTTGRKEFIEDLSNIKYRTDGLKLSVEQEASEGLKEPRKVLYEDKDLVSAVSYILKENHDAKESGNVGDTTDMLERTENGTKYENQDGIINFSREKYHPCLGKRNN
ncbi:putative galacturonosyltransferase 6 [Prunus yedoensis var. nudiflora]|uniref:Putative galacturonosyltransferase 6 n=1 Tax=Prunus yedoensis var. nudiflora TaxID=2094558 RepID=A0A314XPY2_PRUYE|nr:putative galacturonosyltransferase 6 [Prunus yedoensis var. nudiflora]